MKKFINEATSEELVKIFEENEKLREEVEHDYIDNQEYHAIEILNQFKDSLKNWSLGAYDNRNFIDIKEGHEKEFLEGIIEATIYFGLLDTGCDDYAKEIIEHIDNKENMEYNWDSEEDIEDSKEYQELNRKIEEGVNELVDQTTNYISSIYDLEEKTLKEYFVEFYAEERLDEECYFEEGEYILYQDVAYTKSYN